MCRSDDNEGCKVLNGRSRSGADFQGPTFSFEAGALDELARALAHCLADVALASGGYVPQALHT